MAGNKKAGKDMSFKGFTQEQVESFRQAFSVFDRENQGSITSNDLLIVMRNLGQNPTHAEIKEMIAEIDADGNDNIEFDEFITIMETKLRNTIPDEHVLEAFHVFDRDNNGFISLKELQHVMFCLGEVLPINEVKKIMAEADLDQDGQLNYKEFAAMMR
ncbi:uncharacterized protein [Clytia hemisphaerica]|uniref:EF-hand domain-containing protein n=1 Tax=Clytia hemisphaerica TaxID=252671 RepID=A0A7M5X0G2_9CNID